MFSNYRFPFLTIVTESTFPLIGGFFFETRTSYLFGFVIFPLLFIGFAITNKKFSDPNKDRLLMEVVKYVVEKGHYKKISIDDNLSENLYHSFIKQLDNQKRLKYIQNKNNTLYCGSYFGYGFHEDGIKSSIEITKYFNDK